MRSTAAIGIEFRRPTPPFRAVRRHRRPLSSTSVLAAPCPRRLAADIPFMPRDAPATTSALEASLSRPVPLTLERRNHLFGGDDALLLEVLAADHLHRQAPSEAMRLMFRAGDLHARGTASCASTGAVTAQQCDGSNSGLQPWCPPAARRPDVRYVMGIDAQGTECNAASGATCAMCVAGLYRSACSRTAGFGRRPRTAAGHAPSQ